MYMYVAVPYELLFILSIVIVTVCEYVTHDFSLFMSLLHWLMYVCCGGVIVRVLDLWYVDHGFNN